jgi:nucleoside-diphosphate-sugar epimerase
MGPNYDGTLLTESDFCRPLSVYGTSKRDAEMVATRYASRIPVIILRPAFIYGIGDARAPAHLRAILGPLVRPWKSNIRELSFCHVEDVAGSLLAAARSETGSGEVFIISEEEVYTWDGLREILIQLFRRLVGDRDEAVSEAARSLLMRARQIDVLPVSLPRYQYWGCNTKKARSVLGFETVRCVRSDAADVIRSYLVQGFLGPACVSATRKA